MLVLSLVVLFLLGGALYGPVVVEELEDLDLDSDPLPDSVEPSPDPPTTGDREAGEHDPNDPGATSYETDVETVGSEDVEDFVHAEINDRRGDHGLEPIEWDGTVASVSRAHSADMADEGYFSHTNRAGEQPHERFQSVADYCVVYGENIAQTWLDRSVSQSGEAGAHEHHTSIELAEGVVDQWMNSTPHREAILEENVDDSIEGWDRAGVGVAITEEGEVYATQNFCVER